MMMSSYATLEEAYWMMEPVNYCRYQSYIVLVLYLPYVHQKGPFHLFLFPLGKCLVVGG